MNEDNAGAGSKVTVFSRVKVVYQGLLDRIVPHRIPRWIFIVILLLVYCVRVFLLEGWYIVTYALAIYLLNLFIAFISPKFDPAIEEDESDEGPSLPTSSNEEFKPFIRRLPEFKFWLSMTRAVLIAMTCTFFTMFNIPVFWPILVLYFIILFTITMKRQIKHMIRYKYIPFSHGKRRYKGRDETVVSQ